MITAVPRRQSPRFKPQFSDEDLVVAADECVQSIEEAKITRSLVDSKVGKRMYPLHGEAVLAELDRCRSLAWGKQDHLIFYDKPTGLSDEDKEEIWNGHKHR